MTSLVNWNGPIESIWRESQCPSIGVVAGDNLDKCKKSCLEKMGCTAINYIPGEYMCDLLACPQPEPDPSWQYNGGHGYYVDKGKIKEYA